MKKATKLGALSFLMVLFGFSISSAQIFEADGLRMPGDWNGFTNSNGMGGDFDLTKISTGTVRWQTTFEFTGTTGSQNFKFASGNANPWANQWAQVTGITLNTVTSVPWTTDGGVGNNSISITNSNWYTVNWEDNGYSTTDFIFMETSAEPITISSTTFDPFRSDSIRVDITLSGSKSSEEKIYVRYSSDSFTTSAHVEATGSGTSYSATIPATDDSDFYILTTTVDLGADFTTYSGDYDMATINLDNNSGSNYSYNYGYSVEISGDAGWRLLSLPKTGGTVADVSDDSPVQGITGGDNTSNDANFYIYDNSGTFEEPTNVSTAWGDGLGFAMYFFNNATAGSSTLPITLDASGAEPSSDVVVDLYSGATGRYTLVGNPFASNVDLANVSANIAISSNMTFWDNAAGSYTSENISGGLVIQPWQGYWVQTGSSGAGGQLTFGTADKTTSAADTTHFDKVNPNTLRELSFSLASSYNTEKNLKLQIADDASLDFDNYDLLKLGSLLSQNVSAAFLGKMDGEDVLKGVEGIPSSLDKAITLPIMVDLTGESQTVRLSWEGLSRIPSDWSVELHDYETDQSFDLRTIEEYEFEFKVQDSKEKVNPVTVLKSSFNETVKAKSGQSARLGLTITPSTTSVNNEGETKVEGFALSQNYPNPFNPTTTINYSVENAGPVTISVYNLMGQKVAELVNESKAAGSYNVTWNAANAASGMYYYRLEAGGQTMTRKMTLIK